MNFLSLLDNPELVCVIDTSVIVNLHACGDGKQVLTSLPHSVLMAQIAAEELKPGTDERAFLDDLISSDLIEITNLTDLEFELFEKLISTLDDGESATISIAINRQIYPFIDERKGRARASTLQPSLDPGWSLELLRHPKVVLDLGHPRATDVVYLALKEGRMRIPAERADEVINLIGEERARECLCLPKYKSRFGIIRP